MPWTNSSENKERIALVILDVIMPKMNGKEAFDEIRKICPDMKVALHQRLYRRHHS